MKVSVCNGCTLNQFCEVWMIQSVTKTHGFLLEHSINLNTKINKCVHHAHNFSTDVSYILRLELQSVGATVFPIIR